MRAIAPTERKYRLESPLIVLRNFFCIVVWGKCGRSLGYPSVAREGHRVRKNFLLGDGKSYVVVRGEPFELDLQHFQ